MRKFCVIALQISAVGTDILELYSLCSLVGCATFFFFLSELYNVIRKRNASINRDTEILYLSILLATCAKTHKVKERKEEKKQSEIAT